MASDNLRNLNIELTRRDVRYILHAVNELMKTLETEIGKDPEGEQERTPMYADDILNLRDIHNRLKEKAVPVFGKNGLTVSDENGHAAKPV